MLEKCELKKMYLLDLKRPQIPHSFQLYELKFCAVGVVASEEQVQNL